LKRFGELLQPMSGTIENSWSNHENFRIELKNIPAEQMEDLIEAIRKVRHYHLRTTPCWEAMSRIAFSMAARSCERG